jgi:hypothetical protein
MAGTRSTSGAEMKRPDGERMDVFSVCQSENGSMAGKRISTAAWLE